MFSYCTSSMLFTAVEPRHYLLHSCFARCGFSLRLCFCFTSFILFLKTDCCRHFLPDCCCYTVLVFCTVVIRVSEPGSLAGAGAVTLARLRLHLKFLHVKTILLKQFKNNYHNHQDDRM